MLRYVPQKSRFLGAKMLLIEPFSIKQTRLTHSGSDIHPGQYNHTTCLKIHV